MKHIVYILYSSGSDKYYIGQTTDLAARLRDHNEGDRPWQSKKFTYKHRPWVLVYSVAVGSRAAAVRIERKIKSKKSRRLIEKILLAEPDLLELAQLVGVPMEELIGINQ